MRWRSIAQNRGVRETDAGVAISHTFSYVAMNQSGFQEYRCRACGEPNEVFVDTTAGVRQVLVEDCSVCCRPNVLTITLDTARDSVTVDVELEG